MNTHRRRNRLASTKVISGEKDHSLRAKIPHTDETESLAAGVNEVLELIPKRGLGEEQRRRSLEEQVAQRTAELAQANKKLKQELDERKRAEEELRKAKESAEATNA